MPDESLAKKAVDQIYENIGKKYGRSSISTMAQRSSEVREVLTTGNDAIDQYILGVGGLPVGRISEVYGPESSGKTSLLLGVVARVQQMGGVAGVIDAENAMTAKRCREMGADPDRLIRLDPENLEEAGDMAMAFLNSLPDDGPPVILGLDSVPALLTKDEAEGDSVGEEAMGVRARFYGRFCRYLVKTLPLKRAHFMFVNQIRMKIGVVFGNPETTPGGNAIKFYASNRLRLSSGKAKDGTLEVFVKSVKNKVAEPGRKLETRLRFDTGGWDNAWTTLNLAKEQGLVEKGAKSVDAAREALDWGEANPDGTVVGDGPPGADAGKEGKGKKKARKE